MTDNDRTELARIIHKAECGCSLNEDCSTEPDPLYPMVADAVLASDWLARRDAVSGSAVRELATAQKALLDAEHRLQLLAECVDDYGPEGMRTRLTREFQLLAGAASQIATVRPVDAAVPICGRSRFRPDGGPRYICRLPNGHSLRHVYSFASAEGKP